MMEVWMITWEDAEQWARDECEAWNHRDLDAVMARYAEDVSLCSPAAAVRLGNSDGWVRGKAKVREYFAIGMQAPELHFGLMDVLVGVNAICMIFRRETGVTVCDLFELDDERRVTRLFASYGPRL